jgi:hypothetical protein
MTLVWTASELLTGKKFQDKGVIVALKGGKQTYTSTITPQWDADLKLTLTQTSAIYLVELNIATTGLTASDIVTAWDVTGGATVIRMTQAMQPAGTTSSDTTIISRQQSTSAWVSGTANTPAPCAIREKLIVTTGIEQSTLTLKWAQNSSNVSATAIHDYGWAVARRLT